jgi:hypothetical protein
MPTLRATLPELKQLNSEEIYGTYTNTPRKGTDEKCADEEDPCITPQSDKRMVQ